MTKFVTTLSLLMSIGLIHSADAASKGKYTKDEKVYACAVMRQAAEYFAGTQYKKGSIVSEKAEFESFTIHIEPEYVKRIYSDYQNKLVNSVKKMKKMKKYDRALAEEKYRVFGEQIENDCMSSY